MHPCGMPKLDRRSKRHRDGSAMNGIKQPNVARERLVEELSAVIGGQKRAFLDRLPTEELRYLAARGDLQQRYADRRRGQFLLEWEMSAVIRGELALYEMEACGPVNWPGLRMLDVGCGDGGFVIAMARRGARAHGLDIFEAGVAGAKLRARAWELPIAAVVGSATSLPYAAGSFDIVTCGDVIEHVADSPAALREIHRVLRPGGLFWVAAPTRYFPAYVWRDPHHGFFGVALLPRRAATWYLTRLRRALPTPHHYGVERLPTYGATVATLRRTGFDILTGEYRPLVMLRNPAHMREGWKKQIVTTLLALGFRLPLTWVCRLGAELRWPIRLICRKPGARGWDLS